MAAFVLHGVAGSPYVRSAAIMLEEKAVSWRFAGLGFGQHRAPEHLARHPFGRMPVLDHGDFRLYETQAILRYLDRLVPEPAFTPTDARAEARMNQVCGITDAYVFKDLSLGLIFPRLVAPMLGLPVDEAAVAAAVPRAELCLRELARLLGGQPFMAGEQVTLADVMLGPHLTIMPFAPEAAALLEKQPALGAWAARMQARPSFRATTRDRLLAREHAAMTG